MAHKWTAKLSVLILILLTLLAFTQKQGLKKFKHSFELEYALLLDRGSYPTSWAGAKPLYIQHAGGGVNTHTYTNSLEALDNSYAAGERFFELDFDITSDNEVVSIHGWEQLEAFIGGVPNHRCSLNEFTHLRRKDGLTQLTIHTLADWMKKHPGSFVITDVKSDNLRALETVASRFPELRHQFIPQIYRFTEYAPARRLGFGNIILTLYVKNYSDKLVLRFSEHFPLFAVTMWSSRALSSDLARRLNAAHVTVYAHTVNDEKQFNALRQVGVHGVYTDYLRNSLSGNIGRAQTITGAKVRGPQQHG